MQRRKRVEKNVTKNKIGMQEKIISVKKEKEEIMNVYAKKRGEIKESDKRTNRKIKKKDM